MVRLGQEGRNVLRPYKGIGAVRLAMAPRITEHKSPHGHSSRVTDQGPRNTGHGTQAAGHGSRSTEHGSRFLQKKGIVKKTCQKAACKRADPIDALILPV